MVDIETIEQLGKRRGFFYPSSDIYRGVSGFYDYGHLGALMKRKIENIWRSYFLKEDNYFEIEPTIIMHEDVFKASGHLKSFVDPIAKCKKCNSINRADHIVEEILKQTYEGMTPKELSELIKKHKIKCPKCKGELEEIGVLNMMFSLDVGAEGENKVYLRPETAQGSYVNFSTQFDVLRKRIPLGLAIIGKSFRNEISPRQLLIRMREFTQAELQIFFDPSKIKEHEKWDEVKDYKLRVTQAMERDKKPKDMTCSEFNEKYTIPKYYVYHMAFVQKFFLDVLKIPKEKFRFKELSEEERAFYNKIHWDVEINLESMGGYKEIGGVHYRTDHDLKGHEKVSKKSQEIFFDEKKFIPHVLELSFGVDRIFYSILDLFYRKEKDRTFLKIPPIISPINVGVFPLVKKDGLGEIARDVHESMKERFESFYDESGSIGRRYARADEIGITFAITIDHQTKEDNTVTVRDRDTTGQQRIKIEDLKNFILKKMN